MITAPNIKKKLLNRSTDFLQQKNLTFHVVTLSFQPDSPVPSCFAQTIQRVTHYPGTIPGISRLLRRFLHSPKDQTPLSPHVPQGLVKM